MATKTPLKIAIALATYEPDARYFHQQIQSLKEQTLTDWKCFISDDGSSLAALEMIKKTVAGDARFIVSSHSERLGSYLNFEGALSAVPQEFDLVALCDQDDLWINTKLEKTSQPFSDPEVLLVHSDLELVNAEASLIHPSCWRAENRNVQVYDPDLLLLRNNVTGCSAVIRRELLAIAIPFPRPSGERFFHHDLWLSLVASVSGKILPVQEALVKYRQHSANVVGAATPLIRDKNAATKQDFLSKVRSKIKRMENEYQWRKELARFLVDRKNPGVWSGFSPLRALGVGKLKNYQSDWISIRVLLGKYL